MNIRPVRAADASAIAEIYNHYIERTIVTFEERAVPAAAMAERIESIAAGYPYYVAEDERLVGYAYANRWHERCAYRLSVETTIYLAPERCGAGIGTQLYGRLLQALGAAGYHCAIGGIALPNGASIALHEKLGFAKVAHFKEIGRKFDRWIDVAYWQRLLGRAG